MAHTLTPNASYSVTLRVRIQNHPGKLGEITTAIGQAGGDIEGIDIVSAGKDHLIRDITVNAASETHERLWLRQLDRKLAALSGLALYAYFAFVCFDDLADKAKSEAVAVDLRIDNRLGPIKRSKDLPQVLF